MRTRQQSGQAILLMLAGMGIFSFGVLGLAIDVSQIYAHNQMSQTAADAAAQAGVMSIFDGTNVTSAHPFGTGSPPAGFTCTVTDLRTPCVYARNNGFGGTAGDVVTVSFPSAVSGAALAGDPVPAIQVVVQRTLNTTFLKFLGYSTSTAKAIAGAAIVNAGSPVPLLVTHPSLSDAISMNGNASVRVCGGPPRSVQVNSGSATAFRGGSFNLSKGGPKDPGTCTTGTGGDFGVFGGPSVAPGGILLGSTGHYLQPASPILDPYSSIAAPALPSTAPAKASLANGVNGCPASPKKGCNLYSPGLYSSGISVKNETAVFKPGLYYMTGSGGFGNAANGDMVMATGFPNDSQTGSGITIYNSGSGTVGIGANSSATLHGADNGSAYKGLLFFQDRTAAAHTHSLGGGGSITLTGSIYLHNTVATMTGVPTHYQTLSMQGNSTIQINGLIVVNALSMGGTPAITFNMGGAAVLTVRQIAMVK